MTHQEKLEALYTHADSLGLSRASVAPPAWRLMWRFGWEVPPPMFLGFWPLALGSGFAFGTLWGLAMALMSLYTPLYISWKASALAGACFGLMFAAFMRVRVVRYNLPAWSQYTGA